MTDVMRDILEEHLEEASFRWLLWERVLLAPDYDLREAALGEEKWQAHVAGLVEGGQVAFDELLRPALESEEPWTVSSAASALLASRGQGLEEVVLRLRQEPEERHPALRRALELGECRGLRERLLQLLGAREEGVQATAAEALAFRGEFPAEVLRQGLVHEDPRVTLAALEAALATPRLLPRSSVARLLESKNATLRLAAIRAGLTCRWREAWSACQREVEAGGEGRREAMALLAWGGDEREVALLVKQLEDRELRGCALWALGYSGRVEAAESCLEWLEDPRLGALAGEAFSAITGLQLTGDYALPAEEAQEPGDDEEDLEPKPEGHLKRPRAPAVLRWWQGAKSHFQTGVRYLRGQPCTASLLVAALRGDSMRRRHVLAQEVALRSQGACRVQTRALARRQFAEVAAVSADLPMYPLKHMLG